MTTRRKQFGLTVADFLAQAIRHELPRIATELQNVGISESTDKDSRPARLPLSDELLQQLKQASHETGIPASHLLVACIGRATTRKRRWPS